MKGHDTRVCGNSHINVLGSDLVSSISFRSSIWPNLSLFKAKISIFYDLNGLKFDTFTLPNQ